MLVCIGLVHARQTNDQFQWPIYTNIKHYANDLLFDLYHKLLFLIFELHICLEPENRNIFQIEQL